MNNYLNSRTLIFTALAALTLSSAAVLSGCKSDQKGEGAGLHEINYDSVKPHLLPIGQAVRYTAAFRSGIDSLHKQCPKMTDSMWFGQAESFNCDAIAILLQQKDSAGRPAAGVRIYYGLSGGKVRMILVPYDKDGNDMITPLAAQEKDKQVPGVSSPKALVLESSGGQTIEQGQFCPTVCDNGGSGLGGN
jgi:hypothetical protein